MFCNVLLLMFPPLRVTNRTEIQSYARAHVKILFFAIHTLHSWAISVVNSLSHNIIPVCRVACRAPMSLFISFIHYIPFIALYMVLFMVHSTVIQNLARFYV